MHASAYLSLARDLPRPSESQIDAFVMFVVEAHSWYKHLPLFPPGARFVFFLNPNAGRDQIHTETGLEYRDRVFNAPGHLRFHYTWQPTAQYIQRFGHIDYSASAGTSFLLRVQGGVLDTRIFHGVQDMRGQWLELSPDIQKAGEVHLTASVHPMGQDPTIWLARTGRSEPFVWKPDAKLPRDVPNDEDLARVAELLRAIPTMRPSIRERLTIRLRRTSKLWSQERVSPEATDRLELIRRHLETHAGIQRDRIRKAVTSMLELVYDSE